MLGAAALTCLALKLREVLQKALNHSLLVAMVVRKTVVDKE